MRRSRRSEVNIAPMSSAVSDEPWAEKNPTEPRACLMSSACRAGGSSERSMVDEMEVMMGGVASVS